MIAQRVPIDDVKVKHIPYETCGSAILADQIVNILFDHIAQIFRGKIKAILGQFCPMVTEP